jgi:hypothetical protein
VPSTATTATSSDESAKDAVCLRLYEDITDLSMVSVKITEVPKAGKEVTVNCIFSRNGKSELLSGSVKIVPLTFQA